MHPCHHTYSMQPCSHLPHTVGVGVAKGLKWHGTHIQVAEKELKYFALVRTLLLPESSAAGRYELAMFQCSSKRGSAFSYDQHRMRAFGFPTELQVGIAHLSSRIA
jgi:hypothetical protein